MAKQVAIIGLGRFGTSLAQELYQMGHDVLAIDRDERITQSLMGHVTYSVTADATSADLLEELGIRNFDMAVVAIGTDVQSSILTTVLLKRTFGVPEVVARANNDLHGKTLEAVGARPGGVPGARDWDPCGAQPVPTGDPGVYGADLPVRL